MTWAWRNQDAQHIFADLDAALALSRQTTDIKPIWSVLTSRQSVYQLA